MKITDDGMSRAENAEAWAIGSIDDHAKAFRIRRVLWDRMVARMARREGEQVRRAYLIVADKASR